MPTSASTLPQSGLGLSIVQEVVRSLCRPLGGRHVGRGGALLLMVIPVNPTTPANPQRPGRRQCACRRDDLAGEKLGTLVATGGPWSRSVGPGHTGGGEGEGEAHGLR